MIKQNPAQGISVDSDYGDAKVFNVECDCSSDDHAIKMWIEVNRDVDIPDVEITFYVSTWTPWFKNIWERINVAANVLFLGIHRQQHSMLLNKQSATNFAHAILDTVNELEKLPSSVCNNQK